MALGTIGGGLAGDLSQAWGHPQQDLVGQTPSDPWDHHGEGGPIGHGRDKCVVPVARGWRVTTLPSC